MPSLSLGHYAVSAAAAFALLTGCGGLQSPIGARAAPPSTFYAQASRAQSVGTGNSTVHFVYAANYSSDNVSAYAIDASDGALTQVAGSPFAAGGFSIAVAIDPTGKFA